MARPVRGAPRDKTKMSTKTHSIELPTELPTPPEHFNITNIEMLQFIESVLDREFELSRYKQQSLSLAVNAYIDVLDAFVIQANATDGISSIYAQWDKGNLQWSGWYSDDDDKPFDAAAANYLRETDKRAWELYNASEGNRAWGDCLEQAETEISAEINESAFFASGKDAEAQNV